MLIANAFHPGPHWKSTAGNPPGPRRSDTIASTLPLLRRITAQVTPE